MADTRTKTERSRNMARIRSTDTVPEIVVRRLTHAMGYRYRLHDKKLPGKPDMVFARRRKVIFVHGCFWHRHSCRRGRSMPSTREAFWSAKFSANVKRDRQVRRRLRHEEWDVLVVWECQTKPTKVRKLADRIARFLEE